MAHIRSRKHSKHVQLLALLAASVPAAGMAQQSTTLPTVTVKEAPEVPYKADKSANDKMTAPLVDTPKTIQIIKKEVLEEQGAVTLMEALRNTPGITMQMGENGNTSAGDTFQLRGFSLQQSTFVDGIRDLGAVILSLADLSALYGTSAASFTVTVGRVVVVCAMPAAGTEAARRASGDGSSLLLSLIHIPSPRDS